MFGEIGKMFGEAVGTVVGASAATFAAVLGLPVEAVKQAIQSGCTTYAEIREFCRD